MHLQAKRAESDRELVDVEPAGHIPRPRERWRQLSGPASLHRSPHVGAGGCYSTRCAAIGSLSRVSLPELLEQLQRGRQVRPTFLRVPGHLNRQLAEQLVQRELPAGLREPLGLAAVGWPEHVEEA